jgi:hypothetical protein
MTNHLYYGDNLGVLRESIRDESVDLIYLDPPFNSNATYNILFRAPSGEASQAQIEAFEDTWHWNDAAERAFDDVSVLAAMPASRWEPETRGLTPNLRRSASPPPTSQSPSAPAQPRSTVGSSPGSPPAVRARSCSRE